jgi:hypothetical protein
VTQVIAFIDGAVYLNGERIPFSDCTPPFKLFDADGVDITGPWNRIDLDEGVVECNLYTLYTERALLGITASHYNKYVKQFRHGAEQVDFWKKPPLTFIDASGREWRGNATTDVPEAIPGNPGETGPGGPGGNQQVTSRPVGGAHATVRASGSSA